MLAKLAYTGAALSRDALDVAIGNRVADAHVHAAPPYFAGGRRGHRMSHGLQGSPECPVMSSPPPANKTPELALVRKTGAPPN